MIGFLLAIIASLASAAVSMLRRDEPGRMAKALTLRVGLSVALFLLLIAGYLLGLIQPGRL